MHIRPKFALAALGFAAAALAAFAGGSPESSDAEPIRIVLDWTVNTNHTGLYVARDLGYFADEGLKAEIISPPETGADALVAAGKAEIGVSYQEGVTFARAQGLPLVAVAAVIQHNSSGFAARKTAGITRPADFEGRNYGGWGSPVEMATLKALMEADGADVAKVNDIAIGSMDFFAATAGDIDFVWIFYGWDGMAAELRNIDINYIPLVEWDLALDYYTPVLVTSEKLIKDNPDLLRRALRAIAKGYEYAIANPNEAAEILLAAAPELDSELVHASQGWLASKYRDDAPRWGEMRSDVWRRYEEWLLNNDLLSTDIDTDAAFTNEFLPK